MTRVQKEEGKFDEFGQRRCGMEAGLPEVKPVRAVWSNRRRSTSLT